MSWTDLIHWFSGGAEHPYHNLFHCMRQDTLWVTLTVVLDLTVAIGYLLIAKHWWVNQRSLPDSAPKRALGSMRNIFLFCGLCGYVFIPVKMFWPAWRLYDLFMVILGYFTWKYAWGARELKIVYNAIGRHETLASELQASRAEVQRKGLFLNAISHDLRTPLNGLMLQTELADLALQQHDSAMLGEALAEIRASAKATAELLNSFLEIGRLDGAPEQPHVEPIPLRDLIASAIKAHAPAAEAAGIYLRTVGPAANDEHLVLRTDRLKLERVLNNLLSNAVKFTAQGGVEVVVSTSGRDVDIAICDTGVGISPEHQERLFEEFFQAQNYERDRRKGFGLGLAIARRLVRVLGGEIRVWSEPNVGSRFTVHLPGVLEERGGHAGSAAHARVPVGQDILAVGI
jgi:signal transduction histidine kinase